MSFCTQRGRWNKTLITGGPTAGEFSPRPDFAECGPHAAPSRPHRRPGYSSGTANALVSAGGKGFEPLRDSRP
jgi:hypothetical protein